MPFIRRKRMTRRKPALKRLERKVNKLSRALETKTHSTSVSNTGVGTAGLLTSVDAVPQGDSSINREGLSINPLRLRVNYLLESEPADAYNQFRVMVVQSKVGPLVAADFPSVNIPLVPFYKHKYTVLYDQIHLLQNIQTGTGADPQILSSYQAKQLTVAVKRKIQFPDASAISYKGNLYVWCISDSVAINHPDLELLSTVMEFQDA